MAQDNDEIAEVRRKALRNGEEDPVVVAQRYLNIYRQMHIFPPERKEAFNKMLLDLPEDIRNIFGALPGGLMLQDYINDLIEKHGGKVEAPKNSDTKDSSPILDAALSQTVQKQNTEVQQPVQVVQGGNMSVSLGKDFAEQFASAFDNIIQRQSQMQADSLAKLSSDLNKGQMSLAQYITQNKDMQLQAIAELTETLKQNQSNNTSNVSIDNSKVIESSEILKRLEDNQKEINLRLTKMETTSLNNGGMNPEVLQALIKSNEEIMQKVVSTQIQNSAPQNLVVNNDNTERLLELIEHSQAQLIEGVVQKILQNNQFSAQAQSNNNANNIQINTPDTSAQTLMLVNKIADLQASNEKNMETAIERLIEAQKEIYTKIDNERGKEIADAIINGLKSSSLMVNAYIPSENYIQNNTNSQIPTVNSDNFTKDEVKNEVYEAENNNSVYEESKLVNDSEYNIKDVEEKNLNDSSVEISKKNKKKKKKKKDKPLLSTQEVYNNWQGEEEESYQKDAELDKLLSVPDPKNEEPIWNFDDEKEDDKNVNDITEEVNDVVIKDEKAQYSDMEQLPQEDNIVSDINEDKREDVSDSFVQQNDNDEEKITFNLDAINSDDWGFGDNNDAPKEDIFTPEITEQPFEESHEVEFIGNNSYIYMDELLEQDNSVDNSPIIYDVSYPKLKIEPQIYDDMDEDTDPYIK